MTTVVALVLSLLFYGLQGMVQVNEEVYNKKATLSAIKTKLPKDLDAMSNEEILNIFNTQIEQKVVNSQGEVLDESAVEALGYGGSTAENVDMAKEKKKPVDQRAWPIFEFSADDGQKYYILAVRGNGLWDEIWGYLALEDDLKTVAGVAFDHKGETPGLGAEIKDSKAFQEQFKGKKIYDDQGKYTSVAVIKGGAKDPEHEVDGISGATITADGVTEMMWRGIAYYKPYLNELKK